MMHFKNTMSYSRKHWYSLLAYFCLLLTVAGCRKTEYNIIPDTAYLRVFNSLNYDVNVTTKDQPPPFVTMIIDPEFSTSGVITGGKIVGDRLDQRSTYAGPYPANAGNTSFRNTEYPGSEKVLVGPIINGINLSSWAQVPSGKHRVLFYSRPISAMNFFDLQERERQSLLVDSTVDFIPGEIYTMQILQKTVSQQYPLPVTLYLRQEQFTKMPFADTLLYANFYNLSAEGYAAANPGSRTLISYYNANNKCTAFGDTMNLYYSLYKDDCPYPYVEGSTIGANVIPGFNNIWLGTVIRSHNAGVMPYYAVPMFAAPDTTHGILSRQWESFILMKPGLFPIPGVLPVGATTGMATASPKYGAIGCSNGSDDGKGTTSVAARKSIPKVSNRDYLVSCWLPNLIRYTASGTYAQRSFATISTIEIINNQVYMMSVQRTYAPPAK
ncbi:hypothetical protein DVR12_22640 [Chitinophaga silvatica]|uniref:Uncharacterized protein n=1 Tax=Chitinophaga silvatica TaxID=2282649 RepID=A0A3E1Y465_9BACT|nr:hypothetical protein [Chitinophaga silvatica]RFS19436.1 hypothetical protein DVR12_22640 [Chitinophaga silvatica]